MQAMDEEPAELPTPNDVSITSGTTWLAVKLKPPGVCGPRVELELRLAMMECHTWVGIGGRTGRVRRPRRLSRNIWLALDDGGGPEYYLRSGGGGGDDDDRRRRIGGAIEHSLRKEEEYRCLTPAYWDQDVPVGVERAIAVAVADAAQRGGGGEGGTCVAIVDIGVRFEFVYSEPKALLLACDENGGGGGLSTGRSGNGGGGGGEAPSCSICFEEMWREADEVTDLPGCTHSFHRLCVAEWFHKASTCLVCRRDQFDYIPPDYWDLHDMMTNDDPESPDSLPDYYL